MAELQRRLNFQARHMSYNQVRTLMGMSGTLRIGVEISGKMHLITFDPKSPLNSLGLPKCPPFSCWKTGPLLCLKNTNASSGAGA